jgi:hypothetical protein
MTTDNVCFYLQNRLIQTSQTGDTSPFSIPCQELTWRGSLVFITQYMTILGRLVRDRDSSSPDLNVNVAAAK